MALKPIQTEKNILKQDVKAMREGTLGLSPAEQREISQKALGDAQRATQDQTKKVMQAAMATGGAAGQFTGQAADYLRGTARMAQDKAAEAALSASRQSTELAQHRSNQIRKDLARAAERQRQVPAKIANTAMTSLGFASKLAATPLVGSVIDTIGEKLKALAGRKTDVDVAAKAQEAEKPESAQVQGAGNMGGSIGQALGTAAGTAALGPVGGMAGNVIGGLVGDLIGKQKAKRTAALREQGLMTDGEADNLREREDAQMKAYQDIAKALGITVDQAKALAEKGGAKGAIQPTLTGLEVPAAYASLSKLGLPVN
jgi:hypothetical protein